MRNLLRDLNEAKRLNARLGAHGQAVEELLRSVLCGQAFALGQRIEYHERRMKEETGVEEQKECAMAAVLMIWAEEIGL